jgi:FkbH-like protein
MYETEANTGIGGVGEVPQEVIQAFGDLTRRIRWRTVLPWSEHCTECVWPTCYTTCDLYAPRADGRCRRFVDGMVRVECPSAVNGYILKIRFKRWGKLWTPGNCRLYPAQKALAMERGDYRLAQVLHQIALPSGMKRAVAKTRYGFKKQMAARQLADRHLPTCFLLECYNPEPHTVRLSITMRSGAERSNMPFQEMVKLTPGFHRIRVPMSEIAALIDVGAPFDIDLTPNEETNETTLYFGLTEFVKEEEQRAQRAETIKCVVWDLDNTLWDGILVEAGEEQLRLRPNLTDIIRTLDARGILHSIASKNNPEDALRALKKFQLDEYFLCPQISWRPKSEGITAIARQLNIGIDTLLFIDDSEFELAEVKAACPQVRLLNAKHYRTIPQMKDFQVAATTESKNRRKLYQVETNRQSTAESFGNDCIAFLRHCEIELTIQAMKEENLERVHELTQRTNQMNFSGNRYDREVLKTVLSTPHLDTYVLSCDDRFGSYGVIGFCIVDRRTPCMIDLMFSCRIQSKRVEHAFLAYLIDIYVSGTGKDFQAKYRKTPRNALSGRVFDDLDMEEIAASDGVSLLVFRHDRQIPNDGVVRLVVQDEIRSRR